MHNRPASDEDMVGFAFSGGGSRAASQIGALKALREVGIRPAIVAGVSAGAVNGAWFSLNPDELEHHETLWLALRRRDIFPGGPLRSLVNLARHGYVHSAAAWEKYVRKKFGSTRFEDLRIPCVVVAVSLRSGQPVEFDSGEIAPAIMATTAIPGVFPPYYIDGEPFVDGGLLEFMPIPTLLKRNVRTIYALDSSSYRPGSESQSSVVDRCARISATRDVHESISLALARGCHVHLLRPEMPEVTDGRDFQRTMELVQAGYQEARKYLVREAETGPENRRAKELEAAGKSPGAGPDYGRVVGV